MEIDLVKFEYELVMTDFSRTLGTALFECMVLFIIEDIHLKNRA